MPTPTLLPKNAKKTKAKVNIAGVAPDDSATLHAKALCTAQGTLPAVEQLASWAVIRVERSVGREFDVAFHCEQQQPVLSLCCAKVWFGVHLQEKGITMTRAERLRSSWPTGKTVVRHRISCNEAGHEDGGEGGVDKN